MKTYRVSVGLEVEIEAFNEQDAIEAVTDHFGPGDSCGLNVTEFELLDHAELT